MINILQSFQTTTWGNGGFIAISHFQTKKQAFQLRNKVRTCTKTHWIPITEIPKLVRIHKQQGDVCGIQKMEVDEEWDERYFF